MDFNYETNLYVTQNDLNVLKIQEFTEKLDRAAHEYIIKKQSLIEDYIYKNLETSVLEAMKCKIENELLERRMKDAHIQS